MNLRGLAAPTLFACTAVGVCLYDAATAQTQSAPLTKEDRMAEMQAMHWVGEGSLKLNLSHSTFALPTGFEAVIEANANRIVELINARSETRADAYLVDTSNRSEILLEYFDSGYVTLDDLSELNPSQMLQQIKQATEEGNARRRAAGIEELHALDWLQEPTFDHATNTAYWAISLTTPSERLVNAIALRLGRNGYEKFTWIVSPRDFRFVGGSLGEAMHAHSFDSGYRYRDYVSGDKAAGYGIAALIGAVAGAKLVKVAAGGGLLLLLKKLWLAPLLLLGGLWRWIKRLFQPN